jgi:hypothetical protein
MGRLAVEPVRICQPCGRATLQKLLQLPLPPHQDNTHRPPQHQASPDTETRQAMCPSEIPRSFNNTVQAADPIPRSEALGDPPRHGEEVGSNGAVLREGVGPGVGAGAGIPALRGGADNHLKDLPMAPARQCSPSVSARDSPILPWGPGSPVTVVENHDATAMWLSLRGARDQNLSYESITSLLAQTQSPQDTRLCFAHTYVSELRHACPASVRGTASSGAPHQRCKTLPVRR